MTADEMIDGQTTDNTPASGGEQEAPGALWYSAIDDAVVKNTLAEHGLDTPQKAGKAYLDLYAKYEGNDRVMILPEESSSREDVAAFYRKLGTPDSGDEYLLDVPEEMEGGADLAKRGQAIFHAHKLTKDQAAGVWGEFAALNKEIVDEFHSEWEAREEKGHKQLTKDFGASLDDIAARGKRAIDGLGLSKDVLAEIKDHTGSPAFMRLFAEIGAKMTEGAAPGGGGPGGAAQPSTAAQAQAEIDQIYSDPLKMRVLDNPLDPAHDRLKQTILNLFVQASE